MDHATTQLFHHQLPGQVVPWLGATVGEIVQLSQQRLRVVDPTAEGSADDRRQQPAGRVPDQHSAATWRPGAAGDGAVAAARPLRVTPAPRSATKALPYWGCTIHDLITSPLRSSAIIMA